MISEILLDRTPYTYLIGWSNLNTWYYGVRFAKNCHPSDLLTTYFTSSKHVKNFIDINGYPDIVKIRKIFNDVDKARMYEHKVLKRLNVVNRLDFLNKSDGLSIPSQKGISKSEETKQKLRMAGKGKHFGAKSEETKQKIRIANTGKKKSTNNIAKRISIIGIGDYNYEKLTSIEFFNTCICNGISSEQIALNLNVSSTTVLRYAKKLNIKFERNLPIELINKLSDVTFFTDNIKDGKSAIAIANELQIPASSVRRFAKKLNINFPISPKKIRVS